jgi:hypothetical protein
LFCINLCFREYFTLIFNFWQINQCNDGLKIYSLNIYPPSHISMSTFLLDCDYLLNVGLLVPRWVPLLRLEILTLPDTLYATPVLSRFVFVLCSVFVILFVFCLFIIVLLVFCNYSFNYIMYCVVMIINIRSICSNTRAIYDY